MALSEEQVKKFYDEGYLIIPDFADDDVITSLRSECRRIVDEMNPDDITTVFTTQEWVDKNKFIEKTDISKVESWTNDEYFLNSGNNISFFFEDGAKDDKGRLLVDKHQAINKMAHAIHANSEPFRAYTFSNKIQQVAKDIGMVDPIVCQSMYIFKPPHIGGAEGLYGNRIMVRTPKSELKPGEPELKFLGEEPKFEHSKFISGPVKKGTMVLIHGEVVHKSEKNVSDKSREIYTFHVFDQHNVEYNTNSWLKPSETFQRLLA